MGDHHERACEGVQQVLECSEGFNVEVVRGLVENQHVGFAHQQPSQLQTAALAAGEVADRGPLSVGAETEPLGQLRGAQCAAIGQFHMPGDVLDGLQQAPLWVEFIELLGEQCGLDGRADAHAASVGRQLPGDHRGQRALARTVATEDRHSVAGAQAPGQVFEHRPFAAANGHVVQVHHASTQPRTGEPK